MGRVDTVAGPTMRLACHSCATVSTLLYGRHWQVSMRVSVRLSGVKCLLVRQLCNGPEGLSAAECTKHANHKDSVFKYAGSSVALQLVMRMEKLLQQLMEYLRQQLAKCD